MYTLTKLKVDDGAISGVEEGYTSRLPDISAISKGKATDIESINDFEVGEQVLLTGGIDEYHRTSAIREILMQNEDQMTFYTQTSLYQLVRNKVDAT